MSMVAATIASSAALRPSPSTNMLVDLQLVEREPAQVGEGRPAGAEVVDGEPYAELLERAERVARLHRGRRAARARRPRGTSRSGSTAKSCNARAHEGGEVGPLQLAGARRWSTTDSRSPRSRRRRASAAASHALLEHPLADGHDDAGLLRDAQEVAGHDQAPHRVVPAQQRLDRDPAAGGELELRAGTAPAARRCCSARRRARSVSRRDTAWVCMASSNSSWRAPPRRLARYIAASASCSRVDGAFDGAAGDGDADARRHRDLGA